MKYSLADVSVVIPNWNGAVLLTSHLPNILKTAKGVREVIIVDDASEDNSLTLLGEKFSSVTLIAKEKHEGFASTVNAGVREAKGDIVLLLNTDIEPEPGFLLPLLSHFSDQKVFAVGCMDESIEDGRIVLRGRGEAAWKKGFYIHWRGEVDRLDTAWVSCGSGIFRKEIWQKLHGLDPIYNPFYWEDIDISYRALRLGYKLVFEPKSIVRHYHEEGKIREQYSPYNVRLIAYRNQFIFIWKNLSVPSLWIQHIIWTPVRLIQSVISGDLSMVYGYFSALTYLPKIILRRIKTHAR